MKCPICKSKKTQLFWNGKLRLGKNKWTKERKKISRCENCDLIFLNKRIKYLIDNKIFRKLFDGDNSVKKYISFNKPREYLKLKKIKKFISFKNKSILESGCGAATNLDFLKKESRDTAGLDSIIYKYHVEKKHLFYSSFKELKKSQKKFDIILSLNEIEHKFDLKKFLTLLKLKLKKNGVIVFRIPNFNNIYMYLLGINFLKYDYRLSHNYYFTEQSADFLFKKNKFKTYLKTGLNEYSINHLIKYIKTGKRVKNYSNIINDKVANLTNENLENYKVSTSLLYILKK